MQQARQELERTRDEAASVLKQSREALKDFQEAGACVTTVQSASQQMREQSRGSERAVRALPIVDGASRLICGSGGGIYNLGTLTVTSLHRSPVRELLLFRLVV